MNERTMAQPGRPGPARLILIGFDVVITLAAPCSYLHAVPAAAAALVAACDAPSLPLLTPAAISVVWLLAVPVLWRSALHDAVDGIAAIIAARRHRGYETCRSRQPVR